jgi:hypothetical protein
MTLAAILDHRLLLVLGQRVPHLLFSIYPRDRNFFGFRGV